MCNKRQIKIRLGWRIDGLRPVIERIKKDESIKNAIFLRYVTTSNIKKTILTWRIDELRPVIERINQKKNY